EGNKCYPYLDFSLGLGGKQTTVAKSTVNCDFVNESYELLYDPDKIKGNGVLEIEIWNYNKGKGHNLIGNAAIEILPALRQSIPVELVLQPKKARQGEFQLTKPVGKVLFKMIYIDDVQYTQRYEKEEQDKLKQEEVIKQRQLMPKKQIEIPQLVKGKVKINEIAVRSMPEMDGVNKCFPYLDFTAGFGGKQTLRAKTTVNYDYTDEHYELNYDPIRTRGRGELEVEVWNYREGGNHLIGNTVVEILPAFNKEIQVELKLEAKTNKKSDNLQNANEGKVLFKMAFVPDPGYNKKFTEEPEKKLVILKQEVKVQQYVKGIVQISEIGVRGLPEIDSGNKLYAYIDFSLRMGGKQTSVAKKTINYDYEDEQYQLLYDPAKIKGKGELEIEVWNYKKGGNSLIGNAIVEILPALNQQIQCELKLQPRKPKKGETETLKDVGKVVFKMIYIDDEAQTKRYEEEENKQKRK
ncbi:MAG: hypothetical protein EZS28_023088, partial [Streblomastix strix]